MRQADWYFDFISPYAYLQFHQLDRLPKDIDLRLRPVLFAGLLNHWGQLGPAEIPAKKAHTFLLTRWRAGRLDLPFRAPPRHPFNPLALLRLALALQSERTAVGAIFDHVWGEGRDAQDPKALRELAAKLGVKNLEAAIGEASIKSALRANTSAAIEAGVYGVPSFRIGERIFWGDDMFEMMLEWLENPTSLDDPESARISDLPAAAERRRPT